MKTGDTFEHKHFIDEERRPLECRITAIRKGYVFYRAASGSKWKLSLEKFVGEYGPQFVVKPEDDQIGVNDESI